jgi:hypothetical protein
MIMTSSTGHLTNLDSLASSGSASSSINAASWYYREFVTVEQNIETGLETAELDEGETRPSEQIISGVTRLVEVASRTISFPAKAEISVFFGEAIVTWKSGAKEVTLISRGNPDDPKLLRYENKSSAPRSESKIIANATAASLRDSIKWLYC